MIIPHGLIYIQRHTNDLYNEKEEELNSLAIRHAATEAYVDELRLRVGKLAERESATEVRRTNSHYQALLTEKSLVLHPRPRGKAEDSGRYR